MSGTGKSSVVCKLISRGAAAVDLDTPEWSHWVDAPASDALTPAAGQDWVWRLDRVAALLSAPRDGTLFVSGCAENMGALFDQIDLVILLSAPIETIMERLSARPLLSGYGGAPAEREKVRALVSVFTPRLRASADHEVDTARSVCETVDEILTLIRGQGAVS